MFAATYMADALLRSRRSPDDCTARLNGHALDVRGQRPPEQAHPARVQKEPERQGRHTLAAYHEGVHIHLQMTRVLLFDTDVGANPKPDPVLSPARR